MIRSRRLPLPAAGLLLAAGLLGTADWTAAQTTSKSGQATVHPAHELSVEPGGGRGLKPQWIKYTAPDKSLSFFYPAGWKAQAKGSTIQAVSEASGEEVLMISVPNTAKKSPATLVQDVVDQLRREIPDLKTTDAVSRDSRSVSMNMTFSRQGVAFQGQVSMITEADKGVWLSYSGPAAHYLSERGAAICRGVAGSLKAGPDAQPPTVMIPPSGGEQAAAAHPPAAQPGMPRTRTVKPEPVTPPPQPADSRGAASAGEPAKSRGTASAPTDIKDAWFLPAGRELSGFYAASLPRPATTAKVPGTAGASRGSSGSSQAATATGGGDIQVAFYRDGTVRAKYMANRATAGGTSSASLRFEGRYNLAADGRLSAGPLTLTRTSRTALELDKHMTMLQLNGQYDRAADRFTATVETYDPVKSRWGKLAENCMLTRATERQSSFDGTTRGTATKTTVTKD